MYNLILNGYYLEALMFVCAAVLSIMLHELAHGYIAIKNGDLTPKYAGRMNLNPVRHFDPVGFGLFIFVGFGWAKPVPVNPSNFRNYRKGLLMVSIAGVAVNYFLAFVSYPLISLGDILASSNPVFDIFSFFFFFMFSINLSLCVFNLIPIYPLDGFRILESRSRNGNAYIDFMYRYGLYVFIGFILFLNFSQIDILGIIRIIFGWPIKFFWGLLGL